LGGCVDPSDRNFDRIMVEHELLLFERFSVCGQAEDRDRRLVFTNQIRVRRQFIQRHVGFLFDMRARAGELVSIPHVENKQGGIPFKSCRERRTQCCRFWPAGATRVAMSLVTEVAPCACRRLIPTNNVVADDRGEHGRKTDQQR
jgi:hypothetical protein